jgi:hypothetical protein
MILLTVSVEKLKKSIFEHATKAFVQILTDSPFSPQMIHHVRQHNYITLIFTTNTNGKNHADKTDG